MDASATAGPSRLEFTEGPEHQMKGQHSDDIEIPAGFPARLRNARERTGLSRLHYAARCGLTEKTLWDIEAGRHRTLRRKTAELLSLTFPETFRALLHMRYHSGPYTDLTLTVLLPSNETLTVLYTPPVVPASAGALSVTFGNGTEVVYNAETGQLVLTSEPAGGKSTP
jgi:transcriptional regulator with XRE-family HTH domain